MKVFIFRTNEPDAETVGVYSTRELAEAARTRDLDAWNERIRLHCESEGKPFTHPQKPEDVGHIEEAEVDPLPCAKCGVERGPCIVVKAEPCCGAVLCDFCLDRHECETGEFRAGDPAAREDEEALRRGNR